MAIRTPRVLVVTRHTPMPEHDGAGAYLFDLLRYLAQHDTEVHIAWLKPDGACVRRGWWMVPPHVHAVARLHLPGAWELGRLRIFPAIWWLPFKARSLHRAKCVLKFLRLLPASSSGMQKANRPATTASSPAWSALPSTKEATFFERVARGVRPDTVVANYCWLTPLFALSPRSRHIVLTHDVASHRLPLTGAARSDIPAHTNPATPAGEAYLLSRANAILAISPEDAATFRGMQPSATVLVCPKSASVSLSNSSPVSRRCLFVGGPNLPNAEGLRWFLAEVWPLVRAEEPGAHLNVCGSICDLMSEVPAGVTLRGRLQDLTSEYAEAEVVLVPLLRGTGVKIKIVEAASHAKACVTTPVGLQGLPSFRDAVLVAEQAGPFADAVVQLLRQPDLRASLGQQLAKAVNTHFSPDACFGNVHGWVHDMPETRTITSFSPVAA